MDEHADACFLYNKVIDIFKSTIFTWRRCFVSLCRNHCSWYLASVQNVFSFSKIKSFVIINFVSKCLKELRYFGFCMVKNVCKTIILNKPIVHILNRATEFTMLTYNLISLMVIFISMMWIKTAWFLTSLKCVIELSSSSVEYKKEVLALLTLLV